MGLFAELHTPITGPYKQPIGLYINNEWVEGAKGQKFEVVNPSTEEVICAVCEATEKDVDDAVAAARKAFNTTWREVTPENRGRMMTRLADLVDTNLDTLAAIETFNNGKSITEARGDVAAAASCLRYYAGWADKVMGRTMDVKPTMFHYTRHEPIGVIGQIIPWNFPLLMLAWKIGPALATGNTVVMKTAEQTPLSALMLCQYFNEAGFPPGVFNLLSGYGKTAGAAIASHMDIDKVAFTGSTLVGRSILKAAAESNLKKVTLELGGKSPNIVFEDADVDEAVHWATVGVYYSHGQCCCAGTRIFVQESIYDKFVEAFRKRSSERKLGDPFHKETAQGPQISQLQYDRIMGYIMAGRDEGATVLTGGERFGNKGYFIKPTVFTNVKPEMKIMQEEIFGPVCAIAKFKDEADAIAKGNNTTYGLAAAVHTKDISRAIRVSNALKAGTVWINCYNQTSPQTPFGGFKESGIGRELGEYALSNYTEVKTVMINLGGTE